MSSSATRWAIVGCGNVCEIKAGPGLYKNPGSSVTIVMRRDGGLAADFAARHGIPHSTTDADEAINHPEVDAVYVATPPDTHLQYALAVAAAGKPCLVEKPMARNKAECDAMVKAFEDAGLPLWVAYYRRGHPCFHRLKAIIDDGVLGTVTNVRYTGRKRAREAAGVLPWRVQASVSGGGEVMDVGAHVLDILDFCVGPLEGVTAVARNAASPHFPVEDTVSASFGFEGCAAVGSASWCFAADRNEEKLEVVGTKGRVTTAVLAAEPLRLEFSDGTTAEETFDHLPHVHAPLEAQCVAELRGGAPCLSTGVTAARTNAVLDAMLAGYYGGRSDAFWERESSWPRV